MSYEPLYYCTLALLYECVFELMNHHLAVTSRHSFALPLPYIQQSLRRVKESVVEAIINFTINSTNQKFDAVITSKTLIRRAPGYSDFFLSATL